MKVYGGTDPLTGREIRLRKTCKTERAAQIELGKLLEQATAGRQPETNATVAELMYQYAAVADWDLSTRKANEAYTRRVIKPALGHLQVRKIRGPLLDLLYAQLRRCGVGRPGERLHPQGHVVVEPVQDRVVRAGRLQRLGRLSQKNSASRPNTDGVSADSTIHESSQSMFPLSAS